VEHTAAVSLTDLKKTQRTCLFACRSWNSMVSARCKPVVDSCRCFRKHASTWFGCRSFRVCGPTCWNKLPRDLQSTDTREQQGSHKPGKPGIVREFCKPGRVREKSGNLRYGWRIFLWHVTFFVTCLSMRWFLRVMCKLNQLKLRPVYDMFLSRGMEWDGVGEAGAGQEERW